MKRLLFLALLAVAVSVQGETLSAVLSPNHEVPPTTTSGSGSATVTVDVARTTVTVAVNVANLGSSIVGAHIHKGPFGANAGIVLNFIQGSSSFVDGKLTGTYTVPADFGADLVANPSAYYVNVHTTEFPGGAVRGQLSTSSGVTMFGAALRGSNENPANSTTEVGAALIWFDAARTTLYWDIDTGGVASPTLSHIHKQVAGVNGGIVINFATSAAAFVNGELRGSIALGATEAALVADIIANPQGYYVNVHSTAFPAGVLRGQLAAVNEYDIAVAGKVAGALGTNFVTDVRIFNPSFTQPAAALLEYFTGASNTNASAMIAVNVPARATAVLNDVGGATGFNLSGTGGVRVTSTSPLAVTSRIFNDLRDQNKGTFGQFVPSVRHASVPLAGVLPQLSNRAVDPLNLAGFRTNTGYFNANPSDTAVRFELRDAAGTVLGTAVSVAGPLSQTQLGIGSLFTGVDLSNRSDLTLTYTSNAPLVVYASAVDNVTSDQYFVPAQEDPVALTNGN